jgi:hypothetical protein
MKYGNHLIKIKARLFIEMLQEDLGHIRGNRWWAANVDRRSSRSAEQTQVLADG